MIKKVESNVLRTYAIEDINGEEAVGTFYENGLQKPNQSFKMKK